MTNSLNIHFHTILRQQGPLINQCLQSPIPLAAIHMLNAPARIDKLTTINK